VNGNDKVNILLVDDQPGKLLTYEAMLAELGENLIKASSAKEALEHLLKSDITIVLMDVSMPEIDGFELAEIIREHPRYQKTAIIFVSAVHLTDLDRLKGYESGAVDYVSVPIVPALLRAKVSVFAELSRKTREYERLHRELEERVAERTAELQAAVTKQKELADQLREADRRKDEFLALLAHELRNPLAPVRNAARIMRMKGSDDPQMQWCYEVVERQSEQLKRLVDDLLDVSRITMGKIHLRVETVDLQAVIAGAVETSTPLILSRRQQLEIDLPEASIVLRGDLSRLTQVVANLLNNAAKYQSEGGRIEVRAWREGDHAIVSVKDYGIGLPPDMLSEVFELFAQGERSPDRDQGGLGIGLSLVKKLVELHGGSVAAKSDGAGYGSEFLIRLPCLPEERPVVSATNGPAPYPLAGERPLDILVVDDNVDAVESLAILLDSAGHRVRKANDGVSALRISSERRPDVVLLDIGLPGMDGYEVCRRLRSESGPSLTIVAMTGYGQDRDRLQALEAGFDAHTVKPVDLSQLLTLLRDLERREA
jgi:signal transduction histidine kinase